MADQKPPLTPLGLLLLSVYEPDPKLTALLRETAVANLSHLIFQLTTDPERMAGLRERVERAAQSPEPSGEKWQDMAGLLRAQREFFLVCVDCQHPYVEATTKPGPCPSCGSTREGDSLAVLTGHIHATEDKT